VEYENADNAVIADSAGNGRWKTEYGRQETEDGRRNRATRESRSSKLESRM
jgi:hypothetical protein